MGALSGSITANAYYVLGEPPAGFRDRYLEALNKRSFKEIDVASDAEESLGWATIDDPFETRFTIDSLLWGGYIRASVRHELLRIPPTVLKLYLRKELDEYRTKSNKEKLTRAEEEDIRDFLVKRLRKRALPTIRVYDMIWNIDRREVWFWSMNKRMNEVFMDLFQDTFDLSLAPRNPYARLERMGMAADAIEAVLTLEPTAFSAPIR